MTILKTLYPYFKLTYFGYILVKASVYVIKLSDCAERSAKGDRTLIGFELDCQFYIKVNAYFIPLRGAPEAVNCEVRQQYQ